MAFERKLKRKKMERCLNCRKTEHIGYYHAKPICLNCLHLFRGGNRINGIRQKYHDKKINSFGKYKMGRYKRRHEGTA